jgi:hypothetical protein
MPTWKPSPTGSKVVVETDNFEDGRPAYHVSCPVLKKEDLAKTLPYWLRSSSKIARSLL